MEAQNEGRSAYHLSGDEYQLLATGLSYQSVVDLAAEVKRQLDSEPYTVLDPSLGEVNTAPDEVTATVAVVYRESIGGPEDRQGLLREADELVEYRKLADVLPGDAPLPEIMTVQDAGEQYLNYRKLLTQSRRHRVACAKCGRFGYINTPEAFAGCPECSLLQLNPNTHAVL